MSDSAETRRTWAVTMVYEVSCPAAVDGAELQFLPVALAGDRPWPEGWQVGHIAVKDVREAAGAVDAGQVAAAGG